MTKARSAQTARPAATPALPNSPSTRTDAPPDLARLPKRFRDYIRELETRVRALQSAADALAPTRTWVETYDRSSQVRYLPDGVAVCFCFDAEAGRNRNENTIEVKRAQQGGVEVSAVFGSLQIRPEVSNVVRLEVARR